MPDPSPSEPDEQTVPSAPPTAAGDELKEAIEALADATELRLCLQCGLCSGVCPMARIFTAYESPVYPRNILTLAQAGDLDPADLSLWFCLTCETCSRRCPAGVNFRDFMEGLRELLVANGDWAGAHNCPTCGMPFDGEPRLEYLQGRLEPGERVGLELCPRCRKRAAADRLRALQSPMPIGHHTGKPGGIR